jgi:thiol-disulfide isomerase/thioredoxin
VRYTVLEFWALWCAPCIESLPELDEVFQGLQDKPLRFYLVNCDNSRSRAKVRSYVRSHNIESKVVLDPTQNLVRYYNINSWPHLIVIDSEGRVVDRKTGYMPGDELLLEDKLLELLDK